MKDFWYQLRLLIGSNWRIGSLPGECGLDGEIALWQVMDAIMYPPLQQW